MTDEANPEHPRNLIPALCRQFYNLGWVTGTGKSPNCLLPYFKTSEMFILVDNYYESKYYALDLFYPNVLYRNGISKMLKIIVSWF